MTNTADDLWDEMDRESDDAEAEAAKRRRPDPDEPWAKTSSGDADNMTSD